jgi:hypothetical protein
MLKYFLQFQEETKMVTVEDKLVAAKNEENSRIAAETALPAGPGSNNPTVIEQQLPDETSKIVYSDGVYFFCLLYFRLLVLLL